MTAVDTTLQRMTTDLSYGGQAVTGAGAPIRIENPANGETITTVNGATSQQLDEAVRAASAAQESWGAMRGADRAHIMNRLADVLESNADALTALILTDVGTPIADAPQLHVLSPIATLRTFARLAQVDRTEHLAPRFTPITNSSSVVYRPAGVVAAIVPYNYPLNLSITKIGAAMAAGCTSVLMPSPQTPLGPLLLGALAREAGVPDGVLNVLVGDVDVMVQLTEHPLVRRVTFTGSVPNGRQVMLQAAGHLTRSVLELGGKAANIVLPGTKLEPRVMSMHQRYARNAGQGCQSPTRILIQDDQYDEFVDLSVGVFTKLKVGDPWDPTTVVGPLISEAHRARVEGYVSDAVDHGGVILAGGGRPDLERGWFMNPVLMGGIDNSARISQEELFGPVSVLLRYSDLDEAVAISNATEFGLATHLTADNPEDALALVPRLESGAIYINGGGGARDDAPIGGMKSSGVGRERGEWGVREFLEPQHVQWAV